jgi:asparagine synthase (glutamine-hydrolysing)
MSGICGIVTLAEPGRQIGRMTDILSRRGPEGTSHWHGADLSLGHTLLATTPQALIELLPLHDPQSGCAITADVRLDNREELLGVLGIAEDPETVGDGRLILEAYLKWGDACLDHLLGDFAFALWDGRRRRLFCARDHFGMRPFNWFCEDGCFAFASEPDAILALEGMGFRLNDERIADYLADWEVADRTATFFEGISRLPPAHKLVWENGRASVLRYFVLAPQKELRLPSDEAYAEAFREVFTEAVRCRLRSAGPVGAMLSGGLDSSSVVAVASALLAKAREGPLQTFSAVGPDPEDCIETRSVHAMLRLPGLDPTLVSHGRLGPSIAELTALTREQAEPFDGSMALPRAVYLATAKARIKVVLDGVASDVVLSGGNHLARLLRSGRFRQAIREAGGQTRFWGPSYPPWRTLYEAARTAFMPGFLRSARAWIRSRSPVALPKSAICNTEFAAQTRLFQRLRDSSKSAALRCSFAKERVQTVTGIHLTVGRERYDRVASALGIEPRDPFLDLRLVKFCLSLPGDQLERDGWPKFILRKAMAGRLPDEICWRLGKDSLGWDFVMALARQWPAFVPDEQRLSRFVDASVVPPAGPVDNSDVAARWLSKLWFAMWLDRYETSEAGMARWTKPKTSQKSPKRKSRSMSARN